MMIGVPKEIKNNEYRVGLVPDGVKALTKQGHQVVVQKGAGVGSGISDEEYMKSGASLVAIADEVYDQAEMVVKVKEPLAKEYGLIKEDQIIFGYLHLAPIPELTQALLDSKCIGVAYETIQLADGSLPLLNPMSEVAGRMAAQVGSHYLEKSSGGRGVLLSGVPGVGRGKVTIIGGGVVGTNAAKIAVGLGAEVYVVDIDQRRLAYLDDIFGNSINTITFGPEAVARLVSVSDLVIGAVLVPGALAPVVLDKESISAMLSGAVVVDVAIDQGGCFETSRPTTHDDPIYLVDEVIHYCVTNMPSAVSRTATFALTNVTLPRILDIANKGIRRCIREDPALAMGVNLCKGSITHPGVAKSMNCVCEDLSAILE